MLKETNPHSGHSEFRHVHTVDTLLSPHLKLSHCRLSRRQFQLARKWRISTIGGVLTQGIAGFRKMGIRVESRLKNPGLRQVPMYTLTTMLTMPTLPGMKLNCAPNLFHRTRSTTEDQRACLCDGSNTLDWLSDRQGVTYRAHQALEWRKIIWRSDFDAKQPLVLHKTHSELSQ